MRFKSAVPAQLSDDPSPWQKPEPPPFRPPEPPPFGPWFRGARDLLCRMTLPAAVIGITVLPVVAHAQIASGTDPSTIIDAALQFILGPVGIGLAALGLIVMLLQITRFGLAGLLIYVGIISGVFGSAYVVQQILGGAVGG